MVRNVHEREIDADAEMVGAPLDSLASADDRMWPGDVWIPMRFGRPLQVGAVGGHGDVHYTVTGIEVEPAPGGTLVRHVLEGRPRGAMRVVWPLVVGGLHDAVLEDLLDRVEENATGSVPNPARWTAKTRLLRAMFERGERRRNGAAATAA
ncbi:MAG TPA: hypothetical protein VEZ46_17895 [Mycobacteriales bacterium]|nr:hypothetical protein [Mycobacteriales bacterium]